MSAEIQFAEAVPGKRRIGRTVAFVVLVVILTAIAAVIASARQHDRRYLFMREALGKTTSEEYGMKQTYYLVGGDPVQTAKRMEADLLRNGFQSGGVCCTYNDREYNAYLRGNERIYFQEFTNPAEHPYPFDEEFDFLRVEHDLSKIAPRDRNSLMITLSQEPHWTEVMFDRFKSIFSRKP